MMYGNFIARLLCICTFSFVFVSVFACPLYAADQIPGDAKKMNRVVPSNEAGTETESDQMKFAEYKGLRYGVPNKYWKPQGASFIRLKPKRDSESLAGIG
jgi:hypothetical protein